MQPETLKQLYYQMLRIRTVEEKIAELYPEQEMRCPVHLCIGQEAIAVGVCANLSPTDYVLSNHRSHGHYLAKGGNLKAMMAELYGKVTGCSQGKGGSMHLADLSVGFLGATPIVGRTIPIAVGTALGSVMRGDKRVSVIFFGDAATEEGAFHESIDFAVLKRLPVIFVCENNLYAMSTKADKAIAAESVADRAEAYRMRAMAADGNDVVAVFLSAKEAIENARKGEGPTLLECITYKLKGHGVYDKAEYRPKEEVEEWRRRDPIDTFEAKLLKTKLATQADIDQIEKEVATSVEESVAFAKSSPVLPFEELSNFVYAR